MLTIRYSEINYSENLDRIKRIIFNNGVIIYPTDTLYGMGGNFYSPLVIKKLDILKKRKNNPYSVAVADLKMLKELVLKIPPVFFEIYDKLLPGSLTLLFSASKAIKDGQLIRSDKIGIRIPDKPLLLKIIKYLNTPLISTSVNQSGSPPLNSAQKILQEYKNRDIDLLIDEGDLGQSKGSTIIDITINPPRILRKGDNFARINKTLGALNNKKKINY